MVLSSISFNEVIGPARELLGGHRKRHVRGAVLQLPEHVSARTQHRERLDELVGGVQPLV